MTETDFFAPVLILLAIMCFFGALYVAVASLGRPAGNPSRLPAVLALVAVVSLVALAKVA